MDVIMSRRSQLTIKRAFDIVVSFIALTLLSPLIGLITLAIKLDDGGPVLYVQDRVGKDGKIFRCYKFRTMVVGAENKGLGLEVANNDSRITRVGRLLRHWTLDEIPQLFNILKGDMSIVGPRPTVSSQVVRYTPWQRRRLEVKPGMAGWAWIHGRNQLSWSERIELDVWYVDHWSLRLDLYILLKAFLMLFRREGLYGVDGVVHDLE
jgi:lipopolysaccharide/colanic/teichoic acid biosynthesis glycosyltransferase